VLEALLIYLAPDRAAALLRKLAARCRRATLCFADRLPGVRGVDEHSVREALANAGWHLETYLPKPGLARHMGVAVSSDRRYN